jgi:undecaprenyl-diphosphatase
MTAARMLGFERAEAARFALLLAIPAILGAGLLTGKDLYDSGDLSLGRDAAIAAGLAFVAALLAIAAMMAWLRRASFTPFVIYRVILGVLLLALVYGGVL